MKTIFNFVLATVISTVLVAGSSESAAETKYFTKRTVLADFFPSSKRVTYVKFAPTKEQKKEIEKRLGYSLTKSHYTFFVAMTSERVDGYALIDEELGQHEKITFAVKLSAKGVVLRQEVMVYRESWGDEIRDARFRKQFVGKTVSDPVECDHDISAVSGATVSSNSMATGVRRALVLFDVAELEPPKQRPIRSSHSTASR
jgi:Na+-translocating ferredoxin:NAD+ oxidoreductase RnfG subunit